MKFVGLFNGEFKIIEDLDWPHTGNEPVSNKKKWGMNN